MALTRSDFVGVFTPAWQAAAKSAPEVGMLATVKVYDPNSTGTAWVPGVGLTTTPGAVWYTGKARIQPIRNTQYIAGDRVQAVRVSMPLDGPFTGSPRVGMAMDVSNGGALNSDNENFSYSCIETMDSSNPVERTLVFEVNYRAIPV